VHITENKKDNSLKVINTGLVDAYSTSWGYKKITSKGEQFLTPYLPLEVVNERRKKMYMEPKIVYAKLAKNCEAFLDSNGEYAALNTNFFYEASPEITLKYIVAYSNSKLFMFFYDQFFGSLRMAGGFYQFQSPQLRVMPCKMPNAIQRGKIEEFVDKILAITNSSDYLENSLKKKEVKEYENQIDQMVYKLYGLTPEEIKVVEGVGSKR